MNREAELDRPSRVACSDLLGDFFLICKITLSMQSPKPKYRTPNKQQARHEKENRNPDKKWSLLNRPPVIITPVIHNSGAPSSRQRMIICASSLRCDCAHETHRRKKRGYPSPNRPSQNEYRKRAVQVWNGECGVRSARPGAINHFAFLETPEFCPLRQPTIVHPAFPAPVRRQACEPLSANRHATVCAATATQQCRNIGWA